ncbi:carbonic anhydrase [Phytohalomonas tamaricis]|uniref:carbonic anhydrase n=1 Tax=Phytohalomonas tamaricis TaxID=2081032 RepID=UPI000D0ADE72|nr:carbonic anhydrase family protein [Phytohalomonas tamaricis]
MPARAHVPAWIIGSILGAMTLPALAETTGVEDWSYGEESGPDSWASLNPIYERCGSGVNQSPVDLGKKVLDAQLPKLEIDYPAPLLVMRRTANSVTSEGPSGNTVTLNDHEYALRRIEFHNPAEHAVNGKRSPMEIQLVHSDTLDNTLIISVFIEPGDESNVIDRLWSNVPAVDRSMPLNGELTPDELLPATHDAWQYNGSLTTPPCTEGVSWWVMKQPIHASQQQIDQFRQWLDVDSVRPLQPLNARFVLQ